MFVISALKDVNREEFGRLFCDYYAELGCDEDCAHLLSEYIIPDLLAGLIRIDFMIDGGQSAGFVIYQRDDISNDWNFWEGMGDIREVYVIPQKRRQGLGTMLVKTAEMRFKESGVAEVYTLPEESALPFFEKLGYVKSGKFCEETGGEAYKKPLSCGCKK